MLGKWEKTEAQQFTLGGARAPMRVDGLPYKVEQLTWEFVDMTDEGGRMAVRWDKTMASVPFTFGR